MSGPPKTPTNILKMRGSWLAKDREKRGEAKAISGMLKPPKDFQKDERAYWRYYEPLLIEMGVLALTDRDVFADLCRESAECDRLRDKVRKTSDIIKYPSGAIGPNPLVKMYNDAMNRKLRLMQQLGFTPASRANVQVVEGALPMDESRDYFKS